MAHIKKGDFIEVEYTGRTKEEDAVFDTTDEKTAKAAGINAPSMKFGPIVVCLGEGQLIAGLEEQVEGKEAGKEYTIELAPEKAFGKKDAKLIRMIPIGAFKKQNIMPEPGMQINMDGVLGVIKTASGGRCLVDFNHPLSSKSVVYSIKVNRIVTDDKEKLETYFKMGLGVKNAEIDFKEGKASVKIEKEMPKELSDQVVNDIKRVIPTIKEVKFEVKVKEAPKEKSAEKKPVNKN